MTNNKMVEHVKAKSFFLLLLAALLIGVAVALRPLQQNTPANPSTDQAATPAAENETAPREGPAGDIRLDPSDTEKNRDLDAFRERLLAQFEGQLDDPTSQVRLLEELMRYLEQMDPANLEANLAALLMEWFPERGEALLERARAMMAYNRFMEEERYTLRTMDPETRWDYIWNMRRQLFGEDAKIIWQSELRNHQLAQSLRAIDQSSAAPASKVEAYTSAIRQTYEDQAGRILENRRQEFTDRFVSLPSVQASLAEQSREERYQTLRDIRDELGMEDDALDRWSNLDRVRDERWQKGQEYQSQRQSIVDNYPEGAERQQALDELRTSIFGKQQAEIIRNEEESGYYRFEQPRVYGQN